MPRTRSFSWLPGVLGCLAVVGPFLGYSAFLAARAVASRLLAVGLAAMLEGIAMYVYTMLVIEVATAAIFWTTRGPALGLAWVAARVAFWQGY